MYTVKQAIGIRNGINKRWEIIDLNAFTMSQLYQTFRSVQIALYMADGTTVVYLNLRDIAPQYTTSNYKFSDVLFALNGNSLPTSTTGIVLNHKTAVFRDAFRAGYEVTPVNQLNQLDYTVPNSALPNLRLSRSDLSLDYDYVFKHMLVTVNGLYHRTDTDGTNGLMVVDGMKSSQLSGQNQVGLLSFSDMCDIQVKPIVPSSVTIAETGKPVIDMGADMTGKSVILILAGYMVFVDNDAFKQVSSSNYKIDLTNLGLVSRYYELINYIDLSHLGLSHPIDSPTEISIADLTTDETVMKWLTLSQTFMVILDTPNLYTQRRYLGKTGMPNIYISYTQPNEVLVLENGRQPAYWSRFEDGQWRLDLYNNVIANAQYYSNPLPTWLNTAGGELSGTPNHLSRAYLMEIGRDY